MLDLTKVLDGVEPGMRLYCSYDNKSGKEIGEVELVSMDKSLSYPIKVKDSDGKFWWFSRIGGANYAECNCYLSPVGYTSWGDFLLEKNLVKHRFKLGDVIECVLRGHEYHGCAFAIEGILPTGYIINASAFIPIHDEGLWKKL